MDYKWIYYIFLKIFFFHELVMTNLYRKLFFKQLSPNLKILEYDLYIIIYVII